MKMSCFFAALVLVAAGDSLAEGWEPKRSHTQIVPSLVDEWCSLVEFRLPQNYWSCATAHKAMCDMKTWAGGGEENSVQEGGGQNEVKCPPG